jgi:hypothetical protein
MPKYILTKGTSAMIANQNDIELLEKQYEGRRPFFGELHDHAATGGTSDGQRTLDHWLGAMEALKLDFAAILDHKQVRHMYLPQWEDGTFIGGSEPGASVIDENQKKRSLHYNMIFEGPEPLEKLLSMFPEYKFSGGTEGHFEYPRFTPERFVELIEAIRELGGFFVHPHPKQVMRSDDPLDFWFADRTGIEVFYVSMDSKYTQDNYKLWCDLLALGKRVWATAGGDEHKCASNKALTTIYAEEKSNRSYISHLREGDIVCGPVGIRMCMEDTLMGSSCNFEKKRLVACIKDFHPSVVYPGAQYRVDLLSSEGVVESHTMTACEPLYLAYDTSDVDFYRIEVWDTLKDLRIGISNPIWNDR